VHEAGPPIRLPATVLAELARRCELAGPEALGALRAAGRLMGTELLAALGDGVDPERTRPTAFWEAVGEELANMGFGRVHYEVHSGGVASVVLPELPEASGRLDHPGCPFATGMLAGLLGGAAGEPVAVLEVECRAGGHPACRFLVGAEHRLRTVRERLMDGSSLPEALEGV
jgi:predicted hydrocarbon binding protein